MKKKANHRLGMTGLGRMGGAMVRRLLRGGHQCVVFDQSPKAGEIPKYLGKAGLVKDRDWSRIVIERLTGYELPSTPALIAVLRASSEESQTAGTWWPETTQALLDSGHPWSTPMEMRVPGTQSAARLRSANGGKDRL
jgi:hypothetical protein